VVLNVLFAATLLRIYGLSDYSLWLDEGATWAWATRPTAVETATADPNHPPVWWLVTRAALTVLPDDETGLRLPSAVLGVLAVVLAWMLARRLLDPSRVPSRGEFVGLDRGAPVWVAVLCAANPFWLELSQEARMYSALLVETLGLSLLYLRWLDRGGRGTLVAYGLLGALSLHTHYYAAWTLLGHAAHAASAPLPSRLGAPARRRAPFLAAVVAAGLLFLPWFLHARSETQRFVPPAWYDVWGYLGHSLWRMAIGPGLVVLDRARLEAPLLGILAQEWLVVAVVALLWFAPIGLGAAALRRDPGLRRFVLATLVVPLLALLVAYRHTPLTQERYVVAHSPALILLAVLGARRAPRLLRPVLLGGLLLLCVAGFFAWRVPNASLSLALTHGHPYGKEQWREAAAWVDERARPSDPVFLHPGYLRLVWDFYDRGRHPKVLLPEEGALSAEELLARHPELSTAPRAFLVLAHEQTEDWDHYARAMREAWTRASLEAGRGFSFDSRAFPRQWGVRVFSFERR
jgi:hypothetical protein